VCSSDLLAPADLPKDSGRFDLPIALGILAANDQWATSKLSNLALLINQHVEGKPFKFSRTVISKLGYATVCVMLHDHFL
jgi:hypothetical protein